MAKFYGAIGFATTEETAPDVYVDKIEERMYFGDVLRIFRRLDSSDRVVDDVDIDNRISIVGDAHSYNHFADMRYVHYMGANWKVKSVEVSPPRLILTIGGVYNGLTPGD